MNQRKQRKEIDKAIANLTKYSEQALWPERKEQFFIEMLINAANRVDVPINEFGQVLEDSGYMGMLLNYLFELFATSYWDDDEFCMIEEYIKLRGWREAPYAKRYLNALAKSEVKLWEIITVNPGHWVEIRPAGSSSKAIRVYECSGSQNLKRWDCIAARMILLDGKYSFGGGILPFSPDQAQRFPALLESACQSVIDTLNEVRTENAQCQWSDEDIEEIARAETNKQLPDLLFSFWACQTYLAVTNMPTLLNRDGHRLHWSKIKFPLNISDIEEIGRRLHAASQLDFNNDSKEWFWINCDKGAIESTGATVLGRLSITDQHLVATVNSIERAEEIKRFLSSLLSELIGTPLSVHESFESMMVEDYSTKGLPPVETIDVPELITASLDQHYQKILHEPIPALNNRTPKDCSKEKDQHANLIQWLKGLENNTAAFPHMSHYDFKWMWEELGLECIGVDE